VKPANVMLDGKDDPQLMDFGLARLEGTREKLTQAGSVIGTPAYMAPEQARGDHDLIGPASDQYSLGVVLYQLLTGRLPFSGPVETVLVQVMKTEPTPVEKLRTDIPVDLAVICRKAMSKLPADRYSDCNALAADLERFESGEPIEARPLSSLQSSIRWCRRNPSLSALSMVSLILLIAGTVVSSVFAWEASTQAKIARVQERIAQGKTREAEQAADDARQALNDANIARKAAVESEGRLREQLYVSTINSVQQAYDRGDITRMQELLQTLVPAAEAEDLRGFEWYLWDRLSRPYAFGVKADAASVGELVLRVDPDSNTSHGKQVVTAGSDGVVRIWDAETSQLLKELPAAPAAILSLTGSCDGKYIAAGCRSHVVVWEVATASIVASHPGSNINTVEFSPVEQNLLAYNDHSELLLLDLSENEPTRFAGVESWAINDFAFSPDGSRIATSSTRFTEFGAVHIWEIESKKLLCHVQDKNYSGLGALAWSPDASQIAAIGLIDRMFLLNPNTKQVEFRTEAASDRGGRAFLTSVTYTSSGRLVTGNRFGRITLWESDTNPKQQSYIAHAGRIHSIVCDGDDFLYSTGNVTARGWRLNKILKPSVRTPSQRLPGAHLDLTFLNGSRDLCSISTYQALLQDLTTEQTIWRKPIHQGNGYSSVVSIGGGTMIVTDSKWQKQLDVRDIETGEVIGNITDVGIAHRRVGFKQSPSFLISSRSRRIECFDVDPKAKAVSRRWRRQFAKASSWLGLPVALSGDNQQVAVCEGLTTIHILDAKTGQTLRTITASGPGINELLYGRESNTLISAEIDRAIRIRDVNTGKVLQTFRGHTSGVTSFDLSPDGKTLASGSKGGSIRLWNVRTGKVLAIFRDFHSHRSMRGVTKVRFSSDGVGLAACNEDMALVWRIKE